MATFRKRDSGRWQAIVRRKGFPVESKSFSTKHEAEVWAKTIESEMGRGLFVSATDAEQTTFNDLVKRFKLEFAPHHYRKRLDEKEAWRFQCDRLAEAFGSCALVAIDQKRVAKYRDERLKGSDGRKPVGESTVRKEIFLLSKILGFAEKECGILLPRGNPVSKIRKPSEGKGRDRRLSAEEWKSFEDECRKSRNQFLWPAAQFAVETAMRQGEMLNLEWGHIDKVRRLAMLHETKTEEPRAVPLSPAAIAILEGLKERKGKVFPVERLTLYHAFMYACQRAKIKGFTWHDLRHEALSRLAERGDFSVLELAAVSGHKTMAMLKRYTHLQAERLSEKLAVCAEVKYG
ncbi:MAG: site-specific integrase [Rhodocyclaceae bacterium]|nr:MAG: site-specific integrase [Rhodocyclaceae bacterium]